MRIGHYQCKCVQGDFEANLATVIHGLDLAAEAGLDIVSFPESFLQGYFRTEEEARANGCTIAAPEIEKLLDQTRGYNSLFMVGFNELRGDDLYNTVLVIDQGKLLGSYSKACPCLAYFTPGREFPVFEKNGLTFGVVICADGGYIEPTRIVTLKGARVVFAPHFNRIYDPIAHYQMVRNDHVARAVENGVYFLRANNVIDPPACTDDETTTTHGYGDSYLLSPEGEIVAAAGLYSEYLMIYNLVLGKRGRNNPAYRSHKSATALLGILKDAVNEHELGS